MGIYKTKQKTSILKILEDNTDIELTISKIKDIAEADNLKIGLTTIYRCLDDLEINNQVRKNIKENGESEYQLITEKCLSHFHLKCSKCGKTIHLDCHELNVLAEHIRTKHSFYINTLTTTVMGLCDDCYRKEVI